MIGVFITARLGSTRLNEKHLIEVNKKTLVEWLVARFSKAFIKEIENDKLKIFITTSDRIENKKFEQIFSESGTIVFYGSDENIPLRHLQCAIANNIDYIISIDGDDILCSTEASKIVMEKLLSGSAMVQTKGLPLGMNSTGYSKVFLEDSLNGIEAIKLETGWGKIFDVSKIEVIPLKDNEMIEKIRMTLDYEADADFFEKVISSTDVINSSDDLLIDSILSNKWNLLNEHLDDVYWSNFNKQKEEENF
jgi:spore coat polysaccharide biosynthesis protein SpsF (cytidylyltransferase family)